jgi:hypothetical protein
MIVLLLDTSQMRIGTIVPLQIRPLTSIYLFVDFNDSVKVEFLVNT